MSLPCTLPAHTACGWPCCGPQGVAGVAGTGHLAPSLPGWVSCGGCAPPPAGRGQGLRGWRLATLTLWPSAEDPAESALLDWRPQEAAPASLDGQREQEGDGHVPGRGGVGAPQGGHPGGGLLGANPQGASGRPAPAPRAAGWFAGRARLDPASSGCWEAEVAGPPPTEALGGAPQGPPLREGRAQPRRPAQARPAPDSAPGGSGLPSASSPRPCGLCGGRGREQ